MIPASLCTFPVKGGQDLFVITARWVREKDVADRQENRLINLFYRALGYGIKIADRFDGFAEKIKPDRSVNS